MASLSVSDLAARFSGQLLQPTDAGYDDARRVHNGLIDKRPTLIARCRNVADIVDAVNLARDWCKIELFQSMRWRNELLVTSKGTFRG